MQTQAKELGIEVSKEQAEKVLEVIAEEVRTCKRKRFDKKEELRIFREVLDSERRN